MSAARQFFDAISKAKRDRAAAEQADVAGLDYDEPDGYDDLLDDEGDELADREARDMCPECEGRGLDPRDRDCEFCNGWGLV